jgi:hypothetical protein
MQNAAPSNHAFGWLFSAVFALAGGYALWRESRLYPLLLAGAAVLLLLTLFRPRWLAPLNRLWMAVGELFHRIVSPLVLGVIFFAVFTPFGLVMRWMGRDSMKRRFEPQAQTYWVTRDPPGPAAESLREQF